MNEEEPFFCQRYRGEEWRFAPWHGTGKPKLSVRAFWQAEDGVWHPTRRDRGKGFTMSLEAGVELHRALGVELARLGAGGASTGS